MHSVQDPPSAPEDPGLHLQAVTEMLPAGESEFARQLSQLALPRPALYLPVIHCVHVPPFGPKEPGVQVQSLMLSLAPRESELEGHSTQEELPRFGLNVSEGQAAHVLLLAPE